MGFSPWADPDADRNTFREALVALIRNNGAKRHLAAGFIPAVGLYTRPNNKHALIPPNPNEFDST